MRSEYGFTLVELLVAFAISGLLMAGLTVFVGGLAKRAAPQPVDTAIDELMLGGAALATMIHASEGEVPDDARRFITDDSVTFLAPPPLSVIEAGTVRVTLRAEPREGKVALLAELEPGDGYDMLLLDEPVVLTKGWDRIDLEYALDDEGFFDELRITFEGFGIPPTRWTARPMIIRNGDTCVFDPITLECRA